MGNRSSSVSRAAPAVTKDRGALGVEEFLLLHNAVQHHLLPGEGSPRKVQPSTPIAHRDFVKYFALDFDDNFADDFFHFVSSAAGGPGGKKVPFKALVNAVGALSAGCLSDRTAALFHVFSRGSDSLSKAAANRMFSTLFTIFSLLGVSADVAASEGGGASADADAMKALTAATTPEKISHIVSAAVGAEPKLSIEAFQSWAAVNSVCLGDVLASFFHRLFLETPETEAEQPRDLLRRPSLSAPTHLLLPADVLALSLVSHRMQHPWSLLYSSEVDGLSFNRLAFGIGGYAGNMLFVIRSDDGQTFGAFAGGGLAESDEFQGNPLCYLFSLRPHFSVMRPTGANSNFVFFNTRGKGITHGLGFGGKRSGNGEEEEHRLWLNESLDDCHVRNFGECYARGQLAAPAPDTTSTVKISAIEVWGFGEKAGMAGRDRFRADNEKMFHDMKSLKESTKVKFASDGFNQEMFMSKTFQHRGQAAGGSVD
eukprot:INCI18180.1.p1 GENE.INCI18180.1~~INCI18180.1.p1  ORF type:complete len:483 (+),score=96.84 INCI18180.1:116-1564(+)